MVPTLIKYLNQPYPFYYREKKLLQILVVLFCLALFFNYVVQPFETNNAELKFDYFYVALLHSISVIIILPAALVLQKIESSIEIWKLKYEFYFILILLIIIGIIQFLIRDIIYYNELNWSWHYLKEEILNTLIVGCIIAFLVVSANLNIQLLKNSEKASLLNENLQSLKVATAIKEIVIETELKSERFTLNLQNFLYAKAEGNYVTFWILQDGSPKALLKRIKIKTVENVGHHFPNIIRTHRSYLINADRIINVSGNAQGYKLQLSNCNEIIPVSRNYLDAFNDILNPINPSD